MVKGRPQGLYLTGHPIQPVFERRVEALCWRRETQRHASDRRGKESHHGGRGSMYCAVMVTKRGNRRISICTLDDHSGRLEGDIITDALDKYRQLLEKRPYTYRQRTGQLY